MLLTLALLAARPTVTVDSILREMVDLQRLAHRPNPAYTYRQWTSYDRSPEPYANGDAGQFLRTEGAERVMADAKGPGALVRLWSANPSGTIRFYFDGEAKPRLVTDMAALLSGRDARFPAPFAYVAARGCNLYYPMPYAKGLKVTWEGAANAGLYYAVGTRAYAPGTPVTTYLPGAGSRAPLASTAKAMFPLALREPMAAGRVPAGGTLDAKFATSVGGEIEELAVKVGVKDDPARPWDDPAQAHNVLRRLRLRMAFDGETTVDVPLGDFFGSAVGVTPYASLPISVDADGTLIARWTMPFRRSARIWIENGNAAPVTLGMEARRRTALFLPGTYLFHARWHAQTKPTQPRYDFTFLDAKGEGRYVGSGLLVSNPVAAWWGEGDEKVFVDGEAFPSLMGTGTEDYFGYAWSDPTPFSRPYHAQPKTPNLGNQGQTQNLRFHIVDDIPFKSALRFDMEAWHWADVTCTYATTAYWYALPGSAGSDSPILLPIPDAPLPKPVAGAIEGENLTWATTGGTLEMQDGFADLSGGRQMWWRDAKVGATATTTFPVSTASRYEIFANLGHARDYGRFRVTVNGVSSEEIDLYQPSLEWRRESLGTFDLPAGAATIQFEALTANPKSDPGRNMLGVDYLLIERKAL